MPSISDVLIVSDEVANRSIKGYINLDNLIDEKDQFEKDSSAILDLTYPSKPLKNALEFISRKADTGQKADNRGAFLISGTYGTGKSHLLTAVYHILSNPQLAKLWFESNDIPYQKLPLVPRSQIVVMPMLNLPDFDGKRANFCGSLFMNNYVEPIC